MQKIQVSENSYYALKDNTLRHHKNDTYKILCRVEQQKSKVSGTRLSCHAFRVIQKDIESYFELTLSGINISEKRKFERECFSSGIEIQTKITMNNVTKPSYPQLTCLKELSEDHINKAVEHNPNFVVSYQDESIIDCEVTQNVTFDGAEGSIIWRPFELTLRRPSELQLTRYCYLLVKLLENTANIMESTDLNKVQQEKDYLISEIEKLFLEILFESDITFLD